MNSSGKCPVIDEANIRNARELLANLSEFAGEDIAAELKSQLELCTEGGAQRGGDRKQNIKRTIYALLALLAGNAAISATAINTILPGIMMVMNGECGMVGNFVWRVIGLENPVCETWNTLLHRITQALTGDPGSIALLTGAVGAVAATPSTIDAIVDQLASRIEGILSGTIGINVVRKGPLRNRRNRNENGNGDPTGTIGGKHRGKGKGKGRKTRSKKQTKKSKKTRKH